MPDVQFHYVLLGALAIALLVAAATDLRRRQIDNWLNGAIAITAPLYWWASGMGWTDIGWQLASAGIAFVVLAVLFAMRQMGGGDVKLLTALALWIAPLWFLRLLIVMALLGGLLTIAMAIHHRLGRKVGRVKVPYGVAISCAGLWVLAVQNLPSMSLSMLGGGVG
jgi:prepilin peptidase CpaA